MASISGTVSAVFVPEHRQAVAEVLEEIAAAANKALRERDFSGSAWVSVTDGTATLSVSAGKSS